jgi:hypothetical protein
MLAAGSRVGASFDLSSVGHEAPKKIGVFVVDPSNLLRIDEAYLRSATPNVVFRVVRLGSVSVLALSCHLSTLQRGSTGVMSQESEWETGTAWVSVASDRCGDHHTRCRADTWAGPSGVLCPLERQEYIKGHRRRRGRFWPFWAGRDRYRRGQFSHPGFRPETGLGLAPGQGAR